jgi:hypothetical protein
LEPAILHRQEYNNNDDDDDDDVLDPLSNFLYALRAPETKRQYPRRFKMFLDYLGLEGDLNDQAKKLLAKVKSNPHWAQISLMQFISSQKQRVAAGQIWLR